MAGSFHGWLQQKGKDKQRVDVFAALTESPATNRSLFVIIRICTLRLLKTSGAMKLKDRSL